MRWKWFVAIGALIVVILIVSVYAYLNTYDYNKLKPLSALVIGPLGLLAPFVHLGAYEKHPCEIQSIGKLGLQTSAEE